MNSLNTNVSNGLLIILLLATLGRVFNTCFRSDIECLANTPPNRGGSVCKLCEKVRNIAAEKVRQVLPSPHSELLLGTTLGINDLNRVPRFNDMLISTGTIHVVVVSGYNINLVLNRFINLIKAQNNAKKLFTAQLGAVIYALITGFDPPVVRALIMSSMLLWGRFYGYKSAQLRLLVLSALVMLFFDPLYLFNLSFQLSFLASLGLVVASPLLEPIFARFFGSNIFISDLAASLSAQLFVLPVLSYNFGRINLYGFVVNGAVLWLIPLITGLGFVVVAGSLIHVVVGSYLAAAFELLSSIFINLIDIFSVLSSGNVTKVFNIYEVVLFYVALALVLTYITLYHRQKDVRV